MISHEKKFIFIHIPRTGGNTLSNFLRPYCDEESLAFSPFKDKGNLHATIRDYMMKYGTQILEEYTIFTVIRNPWARALSWSIHNFGGEFNRDHFRECVFRPHKNDFWPWSHFHFLVKSNTGKMADGSLALPISYPTQHNVEGVKFFQERIFFPHFIRFENYASEIADMLDKLKIEYNFDDLNIKSNNYPHNHYSHYYLDDEIKKIREVCGFDLQMFGYTFDDRRNK